MITLFSDEALVDGGALALSESAAQHARVRRAVAGDEVRLLDGRGNVASARIVDVAKTRLSVEIASVTASPRPSTLEVLVPVADRDRMLTAAEKCAELQVTAWRPTYFVRSRSVSPRGEGEKFAEKVRLRMQSALEQSAGAWLPDVHPESDANAGWSSVPATYTRLVLDRGGLPLTQLVEREPVAIAIGPEGGFEDEELAAARGAGWKVASLGDHTLRFETALTVAVGVVRAIQFGRAARGN